MTRERAEQLARESANAGNVAFVVIRNGTQYDIATRRTWRLEQEDEMNTWALVTTVHPEPAP